MKTLAFWVAAANLVSASAAFAASPIATTPSTNRALTAPQSEAGTAKPVTVRGTGAAITLSPAVITGADSSNFVISNDGCANQTVQRGVSCQIYVDFIGMAATGTLASAALSLTDSNGNALRTLSLTGKTTAGANDFHGVVNARGILVLTNRGSAATIYYNFTDGPIDEDPKSLKGYSQICHQGLDMLPGTTCALQLVSTSTTGQTTVGAHVNVNTSIDTSGQEIDFVVTVNSELPHL